MPIKGFTKEILMFCIEIPRIKYGDLNPRLEPKPKLLVKNHL